MNKVTTYFTAMLFAMLTGHAFASTPGVQEPDTTLCLEIEGKVSNADQNDTPCKIEILLGDAVVDSIILKNRNRKFIYRFKRNEHYTIRISKEGFQSKSICVHTNMQNADGILYEFYFETTLFFTKPGQIEMPPVATIYFNAKRNCFYYTRSNPYVPGKANCINPS